MLNRSKYLNHLMKYDFWEHRWWNKTNDILGNSWSFMHMILRAKALLENKHVDVWNSAHRDITITHYSGQSCSYPPLTYAQMQLVQKLLIWAFAFWASLVTQVWLYQPKKCSHDIFTTSSIYRTSFKSTQCRIAEIWELQKFPRKDKCRW